MVSIMAEHLNMQDNERKKEFIEKQFGLDILKNIQNKHRGGTSSRKGSRYEDQFLLHKLLQVAANNTDWDNHRLSCQNLDFLDDVCYENLSIREKHNYQLKNSSGAVADWDSEISKLVSFQHQTDIDFHLMGRSFCYLVVSDEQKAVRNKGEIPKDISDYAKSEYFPYYENSIDLVQEKLMPDISSLTGRTSLADCDYCAHLLLGILSGDIQPLTVREILNKAGSEGFPNPFLREDITLPEWFKKLLEKYSIQSNLDKGALSLSYKGFEMKFPLFPFSVEQQSQLQQCQNIQEFLSILQCMIGELLTPKH